MKIPKKVLLVDNDAESLKRLSEILTKNDYQVSVVHAGDEALDFVDNTRPDCIVFEVDLPHLSGTLMYSRLRRRQKTRNLPCIVCSNVGPRPVSYGTGIPVLRKDCTPAEFLNTVKAATFDGNCLHD